MNLVVVVFIVLYVMVCCAVSVVDQMAVDSANQEYNRTEVKLIFMSNVIRYFDLLIGLVGV
jgi:hypothetical protein